MEQQRPLDGELASGQKRKTRQYLRTVVIVAGGIIAAFLILLYGRLNVPSGPDASDPAGLRDDVSSQPDQTAARRQFKGKMNFYESEIKPQAAALNLPGWAPQEQAKMTAQERDAIEAFANGQFVSATGGLDRLIAKVSELQKNHEENFSAALEQAQAEFESDRQAQSLAAIDRVLIYKPDDAAAAALKSRIAAMEEVAALVEAADVARVERRPDKEISSLTRAISLDPARADLAERRRLLVEQQRTRDFDALVQQAWAAFEGKNIKQARASLDKAAQIFSDRKELVVLADKIKQAEAQSAHQTLINKARAAEDDDDWSSAEAHYVAAAKIFPHISRFESRLDLARFINRQTQSLERVLARPARLSDSGVADAARNLIEESARAVAHSRKVRLLTAQLSAAIRQASSPVPVVVHSDNRTRISVLGVGIIGKVQKYRLKEGLKPGNYTFKGERKGFKDKLVRVQVRQGETVSVTVICDESI